MLTLQSGRARCAWSMREVAAAVRQQDLQLRETLHHAVEDEMARRDRGLERVADHVVEIVVHKPLACAKPTGCMKMSTSRSCTLEKNLSNPSFASVRSNPLTLGLISTPRRPSCFTQKSNSETASSASCKGTVPRPTKRSGHCATISAMRSFTVRASSAPSPGSHQ